MKVELESTDKIVTLRLANGCDVPARIWEGKTAGGIACHAFITRIAVAEHDNAEEFERELLEQRRASPVIDAIPSHLVI